MIYLTHNNTRTLIQIKNLILNRIQTFIKPNNLILTILSFIKI